jgi:hypothetical protein
MDYSSIVLAFRTYSSEFHDLWHTKCSIPWTATTAREAAIGAMSHRTKKPDVTIRVSMLSGNHVNRNTRAKRIPATIACAIGINVALVPIAWLVIFTPRLGV